MKNIYLVVVVFEYLWLEEDDLRDADLPPIFLDPRLYNLTLQTNHKRSFKSMKIPSIENGRIWPICSQMFLTLSW